jgi:putative membrane protein
MTALAAHVQPWRWQPHPEVWLLVAAVVGVGLYVSLVIAPTMVAAGYPPIGRRRKGFFWAGVALLWLASDWPLHDLGEQYLFSVHMTQHLLLSFVLPPLFLFATPPWLVQLVIGRGRVGRILLTGARPVVAGLAFNLFIALTHWSAVVNLAVTNGPVHYLLHVSLVVLAVLMWMPVCSPLPELRMSPLVQCAYLFLMSVIPTVPAAWLTFAENAVYSAYDKPFRLWGVSVASDQQAAGLLMKIGGGGFLWAIIIVVFFRWAADHQAAEQSHARASVVLAAAARGSAAGPGAEPDRADEPDRLAEPDGADDVLTWQAVRSELERLGPAPSEPTRPSRPTGG